MKNERQPFYRNFPVRLSESPSKFDDAKIIGWFYVRGQWQPRMGDFVIHRDSPSGPYYIEFRLFPEAQGVQQNWTSIAILSQAHVDSIVPINHPEAQFEIVERFQPRQGTQNSENRPPAS